jgi:hypothetical protein
MGEILTHMIKKAVAEGRLRDVFLPGGKKQQCISQYADDSSFMVRGVKEDVDELVKILETFSQTSGMEIISTYTNRNGYLDTIGSGRRKATYPSY